MISELRGMPSMVIVVARLVGDLIRADH